MKTGSGNKGLDWVIVLGMIAAYPKTADLLSYWSPAFLSDLIGLDVSLFYGMFCAALVEGTILFLHFDRRAHRVASAQTVKWLLFGVSFACQVFDGFITTETVDQMSDELKFILSYGIPALPLIISLLISMIGALPDDDEVRQFKGVKNYLPDFRRLWDGDKSTEFSPSEVVETNLEETELTKSPNGHKEEVVNPTKRLS